MLEHAAERRVGQHLKTLPRKKHTGAWITLTILILLLIALGVWGYHTYRQARYVITQEQSVMTQAKTITDRAKLAVKAQDLVTLKALAKDPALEQMKTETAHAQAVMHNRNWNFLSHIPVLGNDVKVVQHLTSAAHDAVSDILPQFLNPLSSLVDQKWQENGQINLQPLLAVESQLTQGSKQLNTLTSDVQKLPHARIGKIEQARVKLVTKLVPLSRQISRSLDSLQYVTQLLSSPEEKTIILASATTAEIHSSNGLIGSLGNMTVGNNKIQMGEFHSNAEFETLGKILDSPEAERIFNGDEHYYTMDIRDVTIDPDYDNVAKHIMDAWQASAYRVNDQPLGVLMVDPVFVQELIKLTGNVSTPTGEEVTGDNAAQFLQNTVYFASGKNEVQDAIFAAVTQQAVHNIVDNLNPMTAIKIAKVIPDFAKQRHISFYSTDPQLQKIAEDMNLTPRAQSSETKPQIGLYVNSNMASKMDYYEQRNVSVQQTAGPKQDGVTGQRTYTVTLTIQNTLDPATVGNLPIYISGGEAGHLKELLLAYAPQGGTIASQGNEFIQETWNGKSLLRTRFNILPGQQATYTFHVETSPKATTGLTVDQSPLAH